jgi:hypothetical protein
MAKKVAVDYSVVNQEAAKWCMDRGYKIYPIPVEFKELKYKQRLGVKFRLVVEFAGDKKVGSKLYEDIEWSNAIWSVYSYLYNKHGSNG